MTHSVLDSSKTFACCRLRKGISCRGIGMTENRGGEERSVQDREHRKQGKDGPEEKKDADGELWGNVEAQAAFLGPNLWDKTLPYDADLKDLIFELERDQKEDALNLCCSTWISTSFSPRTAFQAGGGQGTMQSGQLHKINNTETPGHQGPAGLHLEPVTKRERSPSPSECCSPDTMNPPSPADSTSTGNVKYEYATESSGLIPAMATISPSSRAPDEIRLTSTLSIILSPRNRFHGLVTNTIWLVSCSALDGLIGARLRSTHPGLLRRGAQTPTDDQEITEAGQLMVFDNHSISDLCVHSNFLLFSMVRYRLQFVPDDLKDDKYWARRRKNNMAAKRSRDARRMKENQIALRAGFLEKENMGLRQELDRLKNENMLLRDKLSKYTDV
ncbi:Hepatic leukemia factor [Eufriesea mexicana]|uniref:Hepatic leukemia factor n=1 Tax=Eufriesea mexicana TaxID=516756 RepID=A0A310S661_9HYME|nr:Hepatic leukemia factor [Eufriesea mexicana]